jgi:hypothetical protein
VRAGAIVTGGDGFVGGLIHAAVGDTGGFGVRPLKRSGWAANAALRVRAHCAVSAAAVPSWTAAGSIEDARAHCQTFFAWYNMQTITQGSA